MATKTENFYYDVYGNMTQHDIGSNTTMIAIDPAHNNRLQSSAGVTYDALGNLASDASAIYTYDPFSQLREKDFSGSTDGEVYLYTAGDERIAVKQNDTWTWSIRDFGGKVLRQYQSSASQPSASWLWMEDYVYREGLLLGADRPTEEGGRRYFHLDHLGTPRLVTGDNGAKIAEHELAPFGIEPTPLWEDTTHGFDREDPMRFTGHERDFAQLSRMVTTPYLDYMHARFYNPTVGRFLSVDPGSGNQHGPQSWNRYSYVANNPLNWTDPTGRCGEPASFIGPHSPCDIGFTMTIDVTGDAWRFPGALFPFTLTYLDRAWREQFTQKQPITPSKLTKDQCHALELAATREQTMGTPGAAGKSSNTFGDKALAPFNVDYGTRGNAQFPGGKQIDVDWFTDQSIFTRVGAVPAYIIGKTAWRLMGGTKGYPFQDPGEVAAVYYATKGASYMDLYNEGCH